MTAYKQDFVPVVDAVRLELESAERAEVRLISFSTMSSHLTVCR